MNKETTSKRARTREKASPGSKAAPAPKANPITHARLAEALETLRALTAEAERVGESAITHALGRASLIIRTVISAAAEEAMARFFNTSENP